MILPDVQTGILGLLKGRITHISEHDCEPNHCTPPNWLDIIDFARTNPMAFTLTRTPAGHNYSTFVINGWRCTIQEAEWRLIDSGAMLRFLSPTEDELIERTAIRLVGRRLDHLQGFLQTGINRIEGLHRALQVRWDSSHERLTQSEPRVFQHTYQQENNVRDQIFHEEQRRNVTAAQAALADRTEEIRRMLQEPRFAPLLAALPGGQPAAAAPAVAVPAAVTDGSPADNYTSGHAQAQGGASAPVEGLGAAVVQENDDN